MIKIGDFARLAHVSIKTLHHYDAMGLLTPVHVDRYSGYRYYEVDQLAHLNRILALKDLGLTLDQVTTLLTTRLSVAEMRGMLMMKQLALASQVEDDRARLSRVEYRLRQLEAEGGWQENEVAVKSIQPLVVLTAQVVAANESTLEPARGSLKELLNNALEAAKLKPATPWFALFDGLPYRETDLEYTLAVGVELRPGQRSGDWEATPIQLQELPAEPRMASLMHASDASTLPQAYASLFAWTQANGLQPAGRYREIYLTDAQAGSASASGSEAGMIEIQCPVEKASLPYSLHSEGKDETMQPKIISRPAFKAVGLQYVGKNEHSEISQMWGRFNQVCQAIKSINDREAFGLCFTLKAPSQPGEFEYVACFEVADDQQVPQGMVYREVPANKYAVFTHHGKLDTLGQTYHYIYNTGLAQARLKLHPDRFDMEVYDKDFELGSEKSKFYIYVAVE